MAYYSPEVYLGEDDLNEDKNNLEGKVGETGEEKSVEESATFNCCRIVR